MSGARTHLEVPVKEVDADDMEELGDRQTCLGPDGAAAKVSAALAMIDGRWKLPILFRLFARPSIRFGELLRELDGVSHKVLTQNLRELEATGLIVRTDHGELPRRVEYALTPRGRALRPVLAGIREFAG